MNKVLIRKSLIHLYTAIGFAVLSMIFYSPLLDGKKLYQSDINQYEAMSREIQENRENIQMKYTGLIMLLVECQHFN